MLLSNDEELFFSMMKKLSLTEEEAIGLIGKKAKTVLKKQKHKEKKSIKKTDTKAVSKEKNEENETSLKQQSLGFF